MHGVGDSGCIHQVCVETSRKSTAVQAHFTHGNATHDDSDDTLSLHVRLAQAPKAPPAVSATAKVKKEQTKQASLVRVAHDPQHFGIFTVNPHSRSDHRGMCFLVGCTPSIHARPSQRGA